MTSLPRAASLRIVPISLKEANAFVLAHHRHLKPVTGHKFSIAVADTDPASLTLHGVVIVGRPVSRMSDDGWTLEVNRCATDGTHNACSMLYRAAWRAAKAIGYSRLITYTLATEPGASLKAAGLSLLGQRGGRPLAQNHQDLASTLTQPNPNYSGNYHETHHQ